MLDMEPELPSTHREPWHGVLVATALPWNDDDTPDLTSYGAHVAWLAEQGCDGIAANGSLGEYQQLSDAQRDAVVLTALASAPPGFTVMPGVGAYGLRQSRRHAEFAGNAGCPAVMLLPPNAYRANRRDVMDHYRTVAEVGVPIVAYNNPFDTRVDLDPQLLAELHDEGLIVAVKEFSCDPRRIYQIHEKAPGLDVLAGSDDVMLELVLAGAVGWIAGYPNALPKECLDLYRAARTKDVERALPLYRTLHPLLRWDSKPEFVQAIKLSMDIVPEAIDGGRCQAPRGPLDESDAAQVRFDTERVLGLRPR